jgi:hypothetical protein
MTVSTHNATLIHRLPTAVDKVDLPDIPTREIVNKARPWAISLGIILFVVASGFWMNASTIIAVLAAPDRIEKLELLVQHCHEDKKRQEVEIQALRQRVGELERQLNFKP